MFITKKELASAYELHPNTLSKKLKEIGFNNRKRLTSNDLVKIFEEFGEPYNIDRLKLENVYKQSFILNQKQTA